MKITISVCGRKQTVTALHDTGNTLRDPVSGRPALVLERNAAEELWPPEVAVVLASPLPPEEKMARLHRMGCPVRFTLLPFRTVGTEAGLLLAAVLLPWFVRLVEFISPKGPELEVISRQIANAHTLFNICCALLWLPLLPWMVRLVCALVPEDK